MTIVTPEEKEARDILFIVPKDERNPNSIRKTLRAVKWTVVVGVLVAVFLILLWALPYLRALK